MGGDPAVFAGSEEECCSAWAGEGLAVGALASRVPGDDHAQRLARAEAVELFELEREVADGGPHVAPLLALQALAALDDGCVGPKGHHVFGEQRTGALEIDAADACLHLEEKLASDRFEVVHRGR